MSYSITYLNKPNYLHAVVIGEVTKENVVGYLGEVVNKCIDNNIKRLLIEQKLDGPRLETDDVYQIVSELSTRVEELFEAVAFVDIKADNVLNSKFAETIANSRNIPVKVFFNGKDAEKWLIDTMK